MIKVGMLQATPMLLLAIRRNGVLPPLLFLRHTVTLSRLPTDNKLRGLVNPSRRTQLLTAALHISQPDDSVIPALLVSSIVVATSQNHQPFPITPTL